MFSATLNPSEDQIQHGLFVKAAGGVRQDLYPASLYKNPQFDPGFGLCVDSKRISEQRALGNKQQTDGHSLTS